MNTNRGLVKYYRLINQEYEFQSDIIPSSHSNFDQFGFSISITYEGDRLSISSNRLDIFSIDNGGGIFIFHFNDSGGNYIETQIVVPDIGYSNDDFWI